MKTFCCERCHARVFFENVSCNACEAELGFVPGELAMASFEADARGGLKRLSKTPRPGLRRCANHEAPVLCNWMVDADDAQPQCVSCRTTQVRPSLATAANRAYWFRIEVAKRQLAYSLLSWGLPLPSKAEDPQHGVAFQFLEQVDPAKTVLTGHDAGLITLNIAEADDARREQVRAQMREPYRTLLGHLRHEIGHYYWDRLIRDTPWLGEFRALFGDERTDYAKALKKHYASPMADWQQRFVSAYASCHPWEDWAECWAHYMHLQDGLETAASWGLQLDHAVPGGMPVRAEVIPHDADDLQRRVVRSWLPVSQFINAMSRSLGGRDSYPFVVPDAVLDKLAFIHRVIGAGVRGEVAMTFGSAREPEAESVECPTP
ncbi:putative zinc-binding metallopeptidase [Pelomonas sp. Root1444]|uniref:zinc-binding metallopeptidase family protein n=1 Tax=Pelomonas sp. Root1444 TaxID=1736464 RepID=UPI0009E9E440|nr:putative zinc-binding metallopeptidase [Pelomonas sp. Root1444]